MVAWNLEIGDDVSTHLLYTFLCIYSLFQRIQYRDHLSPSSTLSCRSALEITPWHISPLSETRHQPHPRSSSLCPIASSPVPPGYRRGLSAARENAVHDFYIVSLWRSFAFWNVVVLTLGLPCGYLCEFAQRIDGLSVIAEAIGGKLPFFAGFRRIAGT